MNNIFKIVEFGFLITVIGSIVFTIYKSLKLNQLDLDILEIAYGFIISKIYYAITRK